MRKLPVLRRVGECNRCGDCCRGNPYTGEDPDKPCPHLIQHTPDLASCEIHGQHDTYWGQGCYAWPEKPRNIAHLPRCSFRFEPG